MKRFLLGLIAVFQCACFSRDFDRPENAKPISADGATSDAGAPQNDAGDVNKDAGVATSDRADAGHPDDAGATADSGVRTPEPCPEDMVALNDSTCIDRYETSVWSSPTCTGKNYFFPEEDYPIDFSPYIASTGCTGLCRGVWTEARTPNVHACSVPGAHPAGYLTWFQARYLCQNADKRLCTTRDLIDACESEAGPTPTGCAFADTPRPTGQCEGGLPGTFDLLGNAQPWLEECTSDFGFECAMAGANAFIDGRDSETCRTQRFEAPGDADALYGARCCRDRAEPLE